MFSERKVVTVIGDEALWAAEECRPVLLAEIARVVAVRRVVIKDRQVLAPRVSSLEEEAVRELLTNSYLHAVVVGKTVKRRSADAYGLITEIRHAVEHVQRGIGRDPVDRIRGA